MTKYKVLKEFPIYNDGAFCVIHAGDNKFKPVSDFVAKNLVSGGYIEVVVEKDEENLAKWKKAYMAILKSCKPYAQEFASAYSFGDIHDMVGSAENHLMLIDWYEKYGLKLSHDYQPYNHDYFKVSDYITFNHFGDARKDEKNGDGRYISWSDDGRQPLNEWLLEISFPSGAYIFGDDYDSQKELFHRMIDEIKKYKPDYCDTANSSFYWKLDNAKAIFNDFTAIYAKYRKLNSDDLARRKIEKLKNELAKAELATYSFTEAKK